MKLSDVINFLKTQKYGSTMLEIKQAFIMEDPENVQRLVDSGMNLDNITSDGKGRGLRYYAYDMEIIRKPTTGSIIREETKRGIERVKEILSSETPVPSLTEVIWSEKGLFDENSIKGFLQNHIEHNTVKIMHDKLKNRNIVYSHQKKKHYNTIKLTRTDEGFELIKVNGATPTYEDKMTFKNIEELAKFLKRIS